MTPRQLEQPDPALRSYQVVPTGIAVGAFTALGLGLRSAGLDRDGLGYGEAFAWHAAMAPLDELVRLAGEAGLPPVFLLVSRAWLALTGPASEVGMRFPAVAAGVLAVPLLYQVARLLLDFPRLPGAIRPAQRRSRLAVALLAPALLATALPAVVLSHQLGPAAFTGLLALLATAGVLRARRSTRGGALAWWLAAGAAAAAGASTEPALLLYVAAVALAMLAARAGADESGSGARSRDARGPGSAAVVAMAAWLGWLVASGGDLAVRPVAASALPGWLATPGLPAWLAAGVPAVLLLLVGIVSLLRPFQRGASRTGGVAVGLGLALLAGYGAWSGQWVPALAVALPVACVALASGLVVLASPWLTAPGRRARAVAGAALAAAVLASGTAAAASPRDDRAGLREIARRIETEALAGDAVAVVAGHGRVVLDYYLAGTPVYGYPEALTPSGPRSDESALHWLDGLAARHGRLWLVLWRSGEVDPNRVLTRGLDAGRIALRPAERSGIVERRLYSLAGPRLEGEAARAAPVGRQLGGWRLAAYQAAPGAAAGDELEISLYWEPPPPALSPPTVAMALVNGAGRVYAGAEQPAGAAHDPGEPVAGHLVDRVRLAVPPGTPPGQYRLIVAGETGSLDLGPVDMMAASTPDGFVPAQPAGVGLGELRLVGHAGLPPAVAPGESIRLQVWWSAPGPVAVDHILAYRLLSAAGEPVVTAISAGAGGVYPSSRWPVGEPVLDALGVRVPAELAPGRYWLQASVMPDRGTGASPWTALARVQVR